mmetsp:Transcript_30450/g.44467  ORF Transcript_30450/g.44467 Transcript_30450/m.44467 type:complete len:531 (-) Transcript_30450:320-1912(-)
MSHDNNHNESSCNTNAITKPLVIFSPPLARYLSSNDARLPPNYIGVRRVRPSNRIVKDALAASTYNQHKRRRLNDDNDGDENNDEQMKMDNNRDDAVVYKVTDENGVQRRMTAKEKKELKLKLREEKKLAKKKDKQQQQQSQPSPKQEEEEKKQKMKLPEIKTNDRYHNLQVSTEALEEELAELRGQKVGGRVTPVMLPGCMARQAIHYLDLFQAASKNKEGKDKTNDGDGRDAIMLDNTQKSNYHSSLTAVNVDDDVALQWAKAIKEKMIVAEEARSKDNIRTMAYQIVPEVWSRLRPSPLSSSSSINPSLQNNEHVTKKTDSTSTVQNNVDDKKTAPTLSSSPTSQNDTEKESKAAVADNAQWLFVDMPQHSFIQSKLDHDHAIVYDCLYRHTNLHVSCGAKFGCDFLLYDGKREERHAFAGLRVISDNSNNISSDTETEKAMSFSIPSPYDLAGYVRGLNTAGKLALLATVITKQDMKGGEKQTIVAFVDLALEKILSAPTHLKKRRKNGNSRHVKRKQVGQNLSKT